jgi:hypothetical protein
MHFWYKQKLVNVIDLIIFVILDLLLFVLSSSFFKFLSVFSKLSDASAFEENVNYSYCFQRLFYLS